MDHDAPSPSAQLGEESPTAQGPRQWIGWILGPMLLITTLVMGPPTGLTPEGWRTAGVALLMATLWITESIPIPATALLPLALFPLLGIAKTQEAASPYAHPLIFLFLGGFLIALAMQRWGLHKRLAIGLLLRMGTSQRRIIAGFLLASSFLSMWVSNTATALMMLPIALSVTHLIPTGDKPATKSFNVALLLSVAYGATTGGMATLIGTPPNALLAAFVDKQEHLQIGFAAWMGLGVPVMLVSLAAVYLVLTRVAFRLDNAPVAGMDRLLAEERAKLGPMSRGEKLVAVVFALTALAWICRPFVTDWLGALAKGLSPEAHSVQTLAFVSSAFAFFKGIDDTVIAMVGGLILFLLPVHPRRGEFALDWKTAKELPWDVLLLFGGGLALAGAISGQGLATYLGELCAGLNGLPTWLILIVICFGILMLTELTSNTATAATFFPVVAAIAVSLHRDPLLFLVPTALAANCSYMMPVGTPPNAIVFGSGQIRLPDMAKAGMLLNLILVPIILGLVLLLGPSTLGLKRGEIPPVSAEAPAAPLTNPSP